MMSEKWKDLGKQLFYAANSQNLDAVKTIVTKSKGDSRVYDWKNEEVVFSQSNFI